MDRFAHLTKLDTREVVRDLINWMDGSDPGWRALVSPVRRELPIRAHLYVEQVARRHRLPESDFKTPLDDA